MIGALIKELNTLQAIAYIDDEDMYCDANIVCMESNRHISRIITEEGISNKLDFLNAKVELSRAVTRSKNGFYSNKNFSISLLNKTLDFTAIYNLFSELIINSQEEMTSGFDIFAIPESILVYNERLVKMKCDRNLISKIETIEIDSNNIFGTLLEMTKHLTEIEKLRQFFENDIKERYVKFSKNLLDITINNMNLYKTKADNYKGGLYPNTEYANIGAYYIMYIHRFLDMFLNIRSLVNSAIVSYIDTTNQFLLQLADK